MKQYVTFFTENKFKIQIIQLLHVKLLKKILNEFFVCGRKKTTINYKTIYKFLEK